MTVVNIKEISKKRADRMTPPPPEPPEIDIKFVRDCYNANELGDGILFATIHKGRHLYNADSGAWLQWTSHHWQSCRVEVVQAAMEAVNEQYMRILDEKIPGQRDDENAEKYKDRIDAIKRYKAGVRKRIRGLRSRYRRSNSLKFATSNTVADLSVVDDQLDQDPWVFACKNGVIDLRTGELLPGRQDQFITRATDVEYRGIEDTNDEWDRFVFEVTGEKKEVADFIRRFYGYTAIGHCREKIFLILNGRGWNGKGLMVETLNEAMGAYSVPIVAEMLLDQRGRSAESPSPALAELKGRRLAYASETDDGARFSASRVKWLSGGDTIRARYPYAKEPVYFPPTHTLVLLTNSIPYASASDYAFWERAKIVDFPFSFIESPVEDYERPIDKLLPDRLQKNLSGILSWIVRGAVEYQQAGLAPPESVLAATRDQREDEDTFQIWIDECCDTSNPLSRTALAKLYENFVEWWKKNINKRPPGRRKWSKTMKLKGFESEKIGVYYFHGIELQPESSVWETE